MKIDLLGRVQNARLPLSKPLLPLFEAVVNSLQSIEQRPGVGRIHIVVRRSGQVEADFRDGSHAPVAGFEVLDDGVGFDERNFESFNTSDSTLKRALGGKGIGRFSWLKAFDRVFVDSIFLEGQETYRRKFEFRLTANGVEDDVVDTAPPGVRVETRVTLQGLKQNFAKNTPKKLSTIATKLIEHCLSYFMSPTCPTVAISDGSETVSVNHLYACEFGAAAEHDEIDLGGSRFSIQHFRVYGADEREHRIHFCAHRREVVTENLASLLPNLRARIADGEGRPFFWWSFVSGDYLDRNVSAERDEFTFPREPLPLSVDGMQTLAEIRNGLLPAIEARLAKHVEPIRQAKVDAITAFVENKAPQYRPVLKYRPAVLEDIAPELPEDRLDLELHKALYSLEGDVRAESHRWLATADRSDPKYQQFLEEANDIGKSNLAKYVIDRRMILDHLEKALALIGSDGQYEKEETIHNLIFPLKTTSDEVHYSRQNLWVIDERLSYHSYLASDKRLDSLAPIEIDSADRPDIVIFNAALALVEGSSPFGAVVIVEFKRPERETYRDKDNPLKQVFGYVEKIRGGAAKDRSGRPITVSPSTPFYCYVICDLTDKIHEFARYGSLTRTPDGNGYFGFNPNVAAYTEVLSYEKLLVDAKKRNRILFEKLNLPLP